MGKRKRTRYSPDKTLKRAVYNQMSAMFSEGFGQSRHKDKRTGADSARIYSRKTYETYKRECERFVLWCVERHRDNPPMTLEACRPYVADYLAEPCGSAYTLTTRASAIGKLYRCSYRDFGVELPKRRRVYITRSRNDAVRDSGVSDETRRIYGGFCRCTGLRRRELKALRGSALVADLNGSVYLYVTNGKGGKKRYVPVIGSQEEIENVVRMCRDAGDGKVFASVPSHLDIHAYRAEYATRYYHMIARDVDGLSRSERYCCRGDKKGTVYDRAAMMQVSKALGHNREDVIAQHYLRY